MKHFEVNFDGLSARPTTMPASPTATSPPRATPKRPNPEEATKQGLRKMKALTDLGMH
jgi:succinylarginine dihydrolase